jgi:hypothetical protein
MIPRKRNLKPIELKMAEKVLQTTLKRFYNILSSMRASVFVGDRRQQD